MLEFRVFWLRCEVFVVLTLSVWDFISWYYVLVLSDSALGVWGVRVRC